MPRSLPNLLAILNGAVPVVLLAFDAMRGDLGANPVNFAIRTTGLLSLIFLVLMLAVTPAVGLTGRHDLGPMRRTFGLYAFLHAAVHFALFLLLDRAGDLRDAVAEITQRTYLWVGLIGVFVMIPLAVTSFNRAIRWMGPKRWKLMHRLAYVAAVAGALHFFLLVKADTTRPIVYGSLVGLALAWRAGLHYVELRRAAYRPATPAGPPRFWSGELRLAAVFRESESVKTFRFVPPGGGDLPFVHRPGQYLNVTLTIDGRPVRRSYTIASPPSRRSYIEISVKREPDGLASKFLHDHVAVGAIVPVAAPAGSFTFTGREAERLVLIAGGIGMTPLLAKIRYLTDIGWTKPIHLLYSMRTPAEYAFRDELAALAARHPNLTVTATCTRDAGPDWTGERGRIDEVMLRSLFVDRAETRFHLCGPTEMTGPLIEILRRMGVTEGQIHSEAFTSPNRGGTMAEAERTAQAGGTIRFARSGRTVADPGGRIVLDVAEAAGLDLPYECRSGVCGRCKVRLLDGEVRHDAADALTASDRTAGIILACQARCLGDIVVDV